MPDDGSRSYMNRVAEMLVARNFTGTVTFDLLLTHGLESNRFIRGVFDGTWFDMKSFSVYEAPTSIKERQNQYFRDHPKLLDVSVLSSGQVKEFLNPESA